MLGAVGCALLTPSGGSSATTTGEVDGIDMIAGEEVHGLGSVGRAQGKWLCFCGRRALLDLLCREAWLGLGLGLG